MEMRNAITSVREKLTEGLGHEGSGRGKGGDIDGQNAFIGVEKLAPGSEEISHHSCGTLEIKEIHICLP